MMDASDKELMKNKIKENILERRQKAKIEFATNPNDNNARISGYIKIIGTKHDIFIL